MKEFVTAAKDDLGVVDEDDVIIFKHDEREVTFFKPSTGQQAIMLRMARQRLNLEAMGDFIALFFEMADEETQKYFSARLMDASDPFDIDSEGGLQEIFQYLVTQWSGKASTKLQESAKSPSTTGRESTATTRVRASTSSRSRSRASST